MNSGTVKFFNDQRGFGFIRPNNGDKDVFIHATALERAGINGLREGQKVNFDTRNDPRRGRHDRDRLTRRTPYDRRADALPACGFVRKTAWLRRLARTGGSNAAQKAVD
jgi:cold shock protein